MLSGTALSGLRRRDLREMSCSGGGEDARSLIGEMLRERGRSGDDLRGPRCARAGTGFQGDSLDGVAETCPAGSLLIVSGVASSFAISNGLSPVAVDADMGGKPGPCEGWPGLALAAVDAL
jgi:hypothetical protein